MCDHQLLKIHHVKLFKLSPMALIAWVISWGSTVPLLSWSNIMKFCFQPFRAVNRSLNSLKPILPVKSLWRQCGEGFITAGTWRMTAGRVCNKESSWLNLVQGWTTPAVHILHLLQYEWMERWEEETVTDTLLLQSQTHFQLWLTKEKLFPTSPQVHKGYIKHCNHDPAGVQAEGCRGNKTC